MKKMCIALDEFGHFIFSDFHNRKETFLLIKTIDGGDSIANSSYPHINQYIIDELSKDEYEEFICECSGRGKMEVVNTEA